MARFELSLKESFRRNKRYWPEEFHNICQGLAMAIAHVSRSAKPDPKEMERMRLEALERLSSSTVITTSTLAAGRAGSAESLAELVAALKMQRRLRIITGTIPVADDAAERFQAVFTRIPDVVSVRRVE